MSVVYRLQLFFNEPPQKIVYSYVANNGKNYFLEWFDSIRDKRTSAIIRTRILRLSLSLEGNKRSLGSGLSELKIDFGPGVRVYFGEEKDIRIILFCGGDKSSQVKDIRHAKTLWAEFREAK